MPPGLFPASKKRHPAGPDTGGLKAKTAGAPGERASQNVHGMLR